MSDHNQRYGWPHRRERARWASRIARGGVACSRCRLPIVPGEFWDLDHADGAGPQVYLGPSHRRCNRGTAGHGLANIGNGAVTRPAGSEPVPVAPERWEPGQDGFVLPVPWRPTVSEHWFGEDEGDPRCGCGPCREHYGHPPAEMTNTTEGT